VLFLHRFPPRSFSALTSSGLLLGAVTSERSSEDMSVRTSSGDELWELGLELIE
jgi:hypothetical protein